MTTKKAKGAEQVRPATSELIHVGAGSLMDRVVSILEQARGNVVRAVNSNMVIAYWLIGREIVEAVQGSEVRAEYGQNLLEGLAKQLTKRYGKGLSATNLRQFWAFYPLFSDRAPIHHSVSDKLSSIQQTLSDEFSSITQPVSPLKCVRPSIPRKNSSRAPNGRRRPVQHVRCALGRPPESAQWNRKQPANEFSGPARDGYCRLSTNAFCRLIMNLSGTEWLAMDRLFHNEDMADTWFTSDFHFGHFNIIRYCNRPFTTTEEMDACIVDRMNQCVKPNDILYFIGDFCMGSVEKVAAYRKRLNCKTIHFVEGNHDKVTRKSQSIFASWSSLSEIHVGKQGIVLCHYAMRVWPHSGRGAWQLYGHSHGNLPDDPLSLSMDFGVDTHDFLPWYFDEVHAVMQAKAIATEQSPLTRIISA